MSYSTVHGVELLPHALWRRRLGYSMMVVLSILELICHDGRLEDFSRSLHFRELTHGRGSFLEQVRL